MEFAGSDWRLAEKEKTRQEKTQNLSQVGKSLFSPTPTKTFCL